MAMRDPDIKLNQSTGIITIFNDDLEPIYDYDINDNSGIEALEKLLLLHNRRRSADKLRRIVNANTKRKLLY